MQQGVRDWDGAGMGGAGGEFEITSCGIVCRGENLTQF